MGIDVSSKHVNMRLKYFYSHALARLKNSEQDMTNITADCS